MNTTSRTTSGTVYLVGAGPGSIGLITVRGVECLKEADLVLYDYLANPAAVEHAPDGAELVCLGHHSTGRNLSPGEIVDRMIAEAQSGRKVVRLKGGDPFVFGRGGDETDALREAGIPFEVVPGVTSGLAVGSLCEIPITHHDDASAVALVTGHERDDKTESHLDYEALAAFPGTLVIYMGVTRVAKWSQALIRHGKAPDTPVAIVRWCSRAQQQMVRSSLKTVTDVVTKSGLRPPALFVVGDVVKRSPQLSWFAERPLFGARILVAGSADTSRKLRDRLAVLGADVISQPAVRITEPADWAPVDAALDRVEQYDWMVFTSGNGVDRLVQRLFDRGEDVRRLACVKLAAAGSGTAERLARYHLHADAVPGQFHPESLAHTLVEVAGGHRFLLPGASRGRQALAEALATAGGRVDQVDVYDSVDVDEPNPDVETALSLDEIDWITITSANTARSLVRLYGDGLRRAHLASISPMTSAALRDLGYETAVEASPHTATALVDAILNGDLPNH
jgi:uroporphyrinogen III methyltransferase/synthase